MKYLPLIFCIACSSVSKDYSKTYAFEKCMQLQEFFDKEHGIKKDQVTRNFECFRFARDQDGK